MYNLNAEISGDQVILTGKSALHGKPIRMVVDRQGYENWQNGMLIQKAFPDMSRGDREILISGNTPEEWEKIFL